MAADLKGRIALVTGVGPGLGQGIAVALPRAGASVVVCDVNDEAIAATRKDVEGEGAECLALRCDMSDSQAAREMFEAARARFGSLHVLVNNAALTPNRPGDTERRNRLYAYNSTPLPRDTLNFTAEMTDEEWHR